jgi:hypothetical protein
LCVFLLFDRKFDETSIYFFVPIADVCFGKRQFSTQADSLLRLLHSHSKVNKVKFDLMSMIAEEYQNINPESASEPV